MLINTRAGIDRYLASTTPPAAERAQPPLAVERAQPPLAAGPPPDG
jgi:hypothetical protein